LSFRKKKYNGVGYREMNKKSHRYQSLVSDTLGFQNYLVEYEEEAIQAVKDKLHPDNNPIIKQNNTKLLWGEQMRDCVTYAMLRLFIYCFCIVFE